MVAAAKSGCSRRARGQRAEDLARDRSSICVHAVHHVAERAAVAVGEGERRVADRRRRDAPGSNGTALERGPRVSISVPAYTLSPTAGRGHRQPPRPAGEVVGEPGREHDVALVREVDAPSRIRSLRARSTTVPSDTLRVIGSPVGRGEHRRAGIEHAGAAGRDRAIALELVDRLAGRREPRRRHTGVAAPGLPPVVGNGRAVACSSARTCAGVSAGCADSISATVPATSGAEKLVPTDVLKLSV